MTNFLTLHSLLRKEQTPYEPTLYQYGADFFATAKVLVFKS